MPLNVCFPSFCTVAGQQPEKLSPPTHQIKTVVQEMVDESHPGVLELVEAGYNPQDCMDAMQQSMGDIQEAMKILDVREMDEGAERGIFVRSISREEPMQDQYVKEMTTS